MTTTARLWAGIGLLAALVVIGGFVIARSGARNKPTQDLPRPSGLSTGEFEGVLFPFLNDRRYQSLGWAVDKNVRDTGPFIEGKYYGTHPAVRVYYSQEVISWLRGGRHGPLPDGAVIVKEQYPPPAARHVGKSETELWDSLESWTVMVKDSGGSHDGWFWSNPEKGQCNTESHGFPFNYPTSGFGIYCVRCHAATQTSDVKVTDQANEFTFSSLRNITGFPGEPIRYRIDESWRNDEDHKKVHQSAHPRCSVARVVDRPKRRPDSAFAKFFDTINTVDPINVTAIPPVTRDHVVPTRNSNLSFMTSDQCMNCHAALTEPFGPAMFVPFGESTKYEAPGWDVSPHGEWRWTAMGLAGRDPVVYAQVESELQMIESQFGSDPQNAKALKEALMDTCLRCHGAMGKRQFESDHPSEKGAFSVAHATATSGPHASYGALARDGVSCTVCHRMQPKPQPADDQRPYLQFFLETQITGNFRLGPQGEIYGPFKDAEISPYVMEHATGWKPKLGEFLKSSQLCGTCHTIALPAIDHQLSPQELAVVDDVRLTQTVKLFQKCHHHVEQATYLEWLNSEYENELQPNNPKARSCQDCHMARGLTDERHKISLPNLRSRIAIIQDTTYPEAENLVSGGQLNVRWREDGFHRHNFAGLNATLVELFRQHPDVLGMRPSDFMTGSKIDADNALASIAQTAHSDTADVSVQLTDEPEHLRVSVVVTNKVGHRFPSGVAFRRAFLEVSLVRLSASGEPEEILWCSGRTNDLGVLVDRNGIPLPTEFFASEPTGHQQFQPHHELIDSESQVQIYETLIRNKQGVLTTSFVRGCETAKDNRLLPRGWKREGPGPALKGRFLEATWPDPLTLKDARYGDGSGTDEIAYRIPLPADAVRSSLQVRATLYYQSLPPYYLANLFRTAPNGPATKRLHSLLEHLDLRESKIQGWKLKIASSTADRTPASQTK
ncbi:MAG: cytochrome P460 family protein [Gemmataceae bacterium]